MKNVSRRSLLKLIGFTATGSLALKDADVMLEKAEAETLETLYDLPMAGSVRILHTTDMHAQALPVFYREPNVNLGVGDAHGKLPHLVGNALLERAGFEPGSIEAYAYTCLDFEENARKYGRMGGVAHLKTLYDSLRNQAGGIENTLTMDGGDLWQGSATSLWTRGMDMVDISNSLGVEVLTGHWEFTYHQEELLSNLTNSKASFISKCTSQRG